MTTQPNDSGPAFPVPMIPCDREGGYTEVRYQGMTLRQWYAGQALCGLLSNQISGRLSSMRTLFESVYNVTGKKGCVTWETKVGVASVALSFADAMLEAEKREQEEE